VCVCVCVCRAFLFLYFLGSCLFITLHYNTHTHTLPQCMKHVFSKCNGKCPKCRQVFKRRQRMEDPCVRKLTVLFHKLHSAVCEVRVCVCDSHL
jgi:hypothetical protein